MRLLCPQPGFEDAVGFPFLLGGTFIEANQLVILADNQLKFPFLLGGTFIEAYPTAVSDALLPSDFPSFWEGLSLRLQEAYDALRKVKDFPSFWEGLSLRHCFGCVTERLKEGISLPFGRDFH